MNRSHALALILVAAASSPAAVHADDPPPNPPRREVPDYDGRPDPGLDPVEGLLWVPRILTSPLYVVSEYVIRVPLAALITAMEESEAFEILLDIFMFGPDRTIGILPTAFFDFGLSPSVGLYAFWDHFLAEQNDISLHAATWGFDWLTLSVRDTWTPTEDTRLRFRFRLGTRPDQQLWGIGYDATQRERARYGIEQVEGGTDFAFLPAGDNEIRLGATYRGFAFLDDGWDGDPSIGQAFGPDELPGAFDTGFSALDLEVAFVVDTRRGNELSQGGVRGTAGAIEHVGLDGVQPGSSWLSWYGSIWVGTDALGRGRVFSLRAELRGVNAVGDAVIPFLDLPELGGSSGPMPGFQPGMIRGQSLVAAVLGYTWPIYALLDARLHFGVGNAFGDTFEDFDFERLRMSFGMSLAPRHAGAHLFEMGVGLGTETFEHGPGEIVSVRFFVGARDEL